MSGAAGDVDTVQKLSIDLASFLEQSKLEGALVLSAMTYTTALTLAFIATRGEYLADKPRKLTAHETRTAMIMVESMAQTMNDQLASMCETTPKSLKDLQK